MISVFAKGTYKGRSPRETLKVFEGTPSPSLSYLAEKTMFFHQLFCSISCAEKEITIQDFVTDAVIEKLELVYKERRKRSRL
jgi:hypothetical protein